MKNSDQYPNADRQIMLRDTAQQHLPSTEVRELVPDYEDEIDLRDLLDVLLRRKWTVITCLLVCFFTAVLVTFSMTPQFKATGSIKVSAQAGNLTGGLSALQTMSILVAAPFSIILVMTCAATLRALHQEHRRRVRTEEVLIRRELERNVGELVEQHVNGPNDG